MMFDLFLFGQVNNLYIHRKIINKLLKTYLIIYRNYYLHNKCIVHNINNL